MTNAPTTPKTPRVSRAKTQAASAPEPIPTPDPTFQSTMGVAVAVQAIMSRFIDTHKELTKPRAMEAFAAWFAETGFPKGNVTLPIIGKVAEVTMDQPAGRAIIADQAAFEKYLDENWPTKAGPKTVTFTIQPGFGSDALVKEIADLATRYGPDTVSVVQGEWQTERTSPDVVLKKLTQPGVTSDGSSEPIRDDRGVVVDGVTWHTPTPTGSYSVKKWEPGAQEAIVTAFARGDFASLILEHKLPEPIQAGNVVQGELADDEQAS